MRVFRPPARSAWLGLWVRIAREWQKNSLPVVGEPRAQLVRAAQPLQPAMGWLEHECGIALRLQRPVRHAEGRGRNRQRIAARKNARRLIALQHVHQINRLDARLGARAPSAIARSAPLGLCFGVRRQCCHAQTHCAETCRARRLQKCPAIQTALTRHSQHPSLPCTS
jgi:hypothetical protein